MRASGPPHGDTRSWGHGDMGTRGTWGHGDYGGMGTRRDVTPLALGAKRPHGIKRTVRSPRQEVTVASRPRRQKTCVFPSCFATPKLLLLRDHNENGVANVMWVPTARLNCRNLGVLGARGSYDTWPCVMEGHRREQGELGL